MLLPSLFLSLSLFSILLTWSQTTFWISSISWLLSSSPFLSLLEHFTSFSFQALPPPQSSPLLPSVSFSLFSYSRPPFPSQLIKFHRVGRGSEGGSTHGWSFIAILAELFSAGATTSTCVKKEKSREKNTLDKTLICLSLDKYQGLQNGNSSQHTNTAKPYLQWLICQQQWQGG